MHNLILHNYDLAFPITFFRLHGDTILFCYAQLDISVILAFLMLILNLNINVNKQLCFNEKKKSKKMLIVLRALISKFFYYGICNSESLRKKN